MGAALAIEAKGLFKSFDGKPAVRGIDIAVPEGSIYGILGPNGAGKTTTLRMLLGIIEPDAGERSLLGNRAPLEMARVVGYLPEERGLYPAMKTREAIAFMGALRGLPLETGRKREEARAAKRADRIAMWVRQALSRPVPVRKLNVGHHMPTDNTNDTSEQRRVVIILVLERENGTNVDEALRSAMALESVNAPIFEALLTRYSLSAAKAFTWVE